MNPRRYRVRNLFLACAAYWVALIAVGLSPALAAIWRMSRLGPGRGRINGGFTEGGLHATVFQDGVTTYSGSVSLLSMTLLLALPPLVMWIVFLMIGSRTNDAGESRPEEQPDMGTLKAGKTELFTPPRSTSQRRSREGS